MQLRAPYLQQKPMIILLHSLIMQVNAVCNGNTIFIKTTEFLTTPQGVQVSDNNHLQKALNNSVHYSVDIMNEIRNHIMCI